LIISELFLCQLKLAWGDVAGAAGALAQAEQEMRRSNNTFRLKDKAAAQAMILLRQGNIAETAQLAQKVDLPLIQARVFITQGDFSASLGVLEIFRQTAEVKAWASLLIQVMAVQSIALYKNGEKEKAVELIGEVLARAEPEGFLRLFLDEGDAMAELLSIAAAQGIRPDYVNRLLTAFKGEMKDERPKASVPGSSSLIEPLSQRELEILKLIAQGLSNREIGERLFLALDTIKGYNRKIFDKLQVQSRTEAIACTRELGLL
jgi:LuxR family maltose regulon positive regulatory protein